MERAITKQFSKSAYVLMAPFLRPILKKAAWTQLELWALAILREIVVAYAVHKLQGRRNQMESFKLLLPLQDGHFQGIKMQQ